MTLPTSEVAPQAAPSVGTDTAHVAPNGYISARLDDGGSIEFQTCTRCGERIRMIDFAAGMLPLAPGEAVGSGCSGSRARAATGVSPMAKTGKPRGRPRKQDLPGMEDRAIKPLEDIAAAYADVRDRRIALNKEESELKTHALKLMHKYEKTIYRHDGIEIRLVEGEEDVKVKVKKAGDEEPDEPPTDAGDEASADA